MNVTANNTFDLFKEANKHKTRFVTVVFKPIELNDFPEITHHLDSVKSIVGTQKIETFDVITESSDILKLRQSKDVAKMYFNTQNES